MQPTTRRIVQALTYEGIAVCLVGPALVMLFNKPVATAMSLAVFLSFCALTWNYVFNSLFECWEARQPKKGRPLNRRIVHAVGFEGGLVVMLVPVMAWWLDIGLIEAFVADLAMLVFFFLYSVIFTWMFDSLFGLPVSATQGA